MDILVLCTGSSTESQSSGTLHPQSLKLLMAEGYDVSGLSSKRWNVFAAPDVPKMDAIITVCGSAASEACPLWPGAQAPAGFRLAYDILIRRAAHFIQGEPSAMSPQQLQAHLTACGMMA